MPFNPIAHAIGQSPDLTAAAVSGTMNATGATFLVAWVSQANLFPVGIATVTDSTSANSWTALAPQSGGATGDVAGCLFYTLNPTVTSSMRVIATPGAANSGVGISVSAYSGAKVSGVFDQQNGTTSASTTVGTIQPGSVTPSEDSELVVTGFTGVSEAATINSGFTITDAAAVAPGAAYANAMAYKIQTSAAAVNPTWSVVTPQVAATAIATFKASPSDATAFTATARQTAVNQNQKGFVDIAPSPPSAPFNATTTIIASSTTGTCNFIRQSDGAQSVGSVTLSGIGTAIMEVYSTQSATDMVFSWTTDNATITSPAATSFTVQAVESAFVAATPSMLWNYSVANSGFLTTPSAASTVAHGTGFSQIVIAAAGTRVWGEYITDTRRTICIPAATPEPSDVSKHEIYLENSTPVTAYNIKIYEDETNVFGAGFEFPDVTGVYVWYDRITPFNGKERLTVNLFYYDNDGTLPKITSTISNLTTFFAAFSTDPVGKASINYIPENTTITLAFTASTDIITIPGSWTAVMPFVIKGLSRTTSRIEGTDPNWYNIIETDLNVQTVQFENLTYDPTNIGQFFAKNSGSLIFKDCDIIETLGEFSKNSGVTTSSQWACSNGVFFINCKVRAVSCSGVAGFRASGDGLRNLIPDAVVGFDFFQNAYTGHVFSTYAKRISTDDTMPADALTYLTVASSAFNVGTNSNLTKIIIADMPQTSGYEWLKYAESVQLSGQNYPTVIGRTDVPNGIIYAAGDLTANMTAGTQITISAAFQGRLHYVETLVVTGATNNHDGTATVTWADSLQPETAISAYENMQFATTTTTTALKGLRFAKNAVPSGRSVIVNGELAGSAVAGDLIWFMQEFHADANQIGLQGQQAQNPGPIIEMNYLNKGFQTGLFQPGASYTVSGFATINVISVGVQFQLQQQAENILFQNNTVLNNILQNTFTSGVDFSIIGSLVVSTSATAPTTWNDGALFTNSHGIDEALPNGVGNTTGAITYDAFYNSTTSALQSRVWNTNVAFDLYGNAATTNGSTYSRIGAVLGDPSGAVVVSGTVSTNGMNITLVFVADTVVINDNDLFEVYVNGVLTPHGTVVDVPGGDVEGLTKRINMLSVIYSTDVVTVTLLAGAVDIDGEPNVETDNIPITNNSTVTPIPIFAGTISHVTSGLLLGMV